MRKQGIEHLAEVVAEILEDEEVSEAFKAYYNLRIAQMNKLPEDGNKLEVFLEHIESAAARQERGAALDKFLALVKKKVEAK